VDELDLDLSGIQDPVAARVTDLIRLSAAIDKTTSDDSKEMLEAAMALALHDLKQVVLPPVVFQGSNIIPFPGGRDVH
jgi:hypothetical protein